MKTPPLVLALVLVLG